MRSKWVVCAVITAVLALALPAFTQGTGQRADDNFSLVPMHPEALKILKAQGRLKDPFPNSANQGRKFTPQGELVGQLTTAAQQKVLVIFVQFTDQPPGGPATRLDLASYFDPMLFGTVYDPPEYAAWLNTHPGKSYPKDRTLYNFYKKVSYGAVDVVTLDMPSTLGWTNVGKPYSYYCNNANGMGAYPNNAQSLVLDAVKAVDDVVDFSQYAVEGTVPNIFVVHAGSGGEWNGDPTLIWSHSWSLGWPLGNPNGYMTNDGVYVNNYAMMPEVGGDTTNYLGRGVRGPYPPTVGVYAHEFAHVLGVPDQYDYGYESEGTGVFSLMAGGSWNSAPAGYGLFNGNSPSYLDAWSKYRLGFVTPTAVTGPMTLTLPPAETNAVMYRIDVPNSGGREYFLLENRQLLGFDEGLNMDAGLGFDYYDISGTATHGLAIYHVDDNVLTRNYWRPNEAENWKEWRSEGAKKSWGNGETHYGISLVQADDFWGMEHNWYYTYSSDLFPGLYARNAFTSFTSPNSSSYYFWAGSQPKFGYSGVAITNIQETNGGTITATFGWDH